MNLNELKKQHDEFKTMLNRGFSNAVCLKDCAKMGDELISLLEAAIPYLRELDDECLGNHSDGLEALLKKLTVDV